MYNYEFFAKPTLTLHLESVVYLKRLIKSKVRFSPYAVHIWYTLDNFLLDKSIECIVFTIIVFCCGRILYILYV